MRSNRGFTLIELVMIIVILGILSVVAIPRYINMQSEAELAAAFGYIGALNSALTAHVADHHLTGAPWVSSGEAAMAFLEEGSETPKGLTYKKNVWTTSDLNEHWTFYKANAPPPGCLDQQAGPW